MADPQTDAAIAKAWPKRWARATRSKQRTKLRRAWRIHNDIIALRAAGHSCADCRSFERGKRAELSGHICRAHSDFYGYVITTADNICADWHERQS